MDIATLVGVSTGLVLVVWAIMMGSGLGAFIDIPAMLITVGGTIAATLINFPLAKVLGVVAIMKKTLLYKLPSMDNEIKRISEFAQIARREGLLALEDKLEGLDEPLLHKGIQLVIDGTPPEVLRSILTIDVSTMCDRHAEGKTILESMGAFAPAFGMVGTLIGLVQMLGNLKDPSQVGGGMAVALITTFYGALMANLIFLPLAGKLGARHKEEALLKELLIEGILSIQAGDNPRTIEEKLKSFLPPSARPGGKKETA
ncbi:MAG TPA: motility protein A [Planctomycetota bacterium]|nr:motility protein A [Planctomycetota bacterium]